MTTTTYTDYPFTTNGVNFISRVYSNSPFATTVSRLPEGIFASMNIQAVAEIIGDASLFTREELLSELDRINDGGSHAFILLGENA
jgi:phosphoribulokinase